MKVLIESFCKKLNLNFKVRSVFPYLRPLQQSGQMGEGGRLIIDVIIIAIIVIILIIMIIIVLIIICKVGEEVEEGGGRDREWVWTTSSSESTAALSRATKINSIRKEM